MENSLPLSESDIVLRQIKHVADSGEKGMSASSIRVCIAQLGVICIAFTMTLGARASVAYTVTDLGALPGTAGDYGGAAMAINGAGTILAGVSSGTAGEFATRYTVGAGGSGAASDIGRLANINYSRATGVNDSGQIVGWSLISDSPNRRRAFLYGSGVMKDLGEPVGFTDGVALGINNAGQVVGYSFNFSNLSLLQPGHAFLYSAGKISDIGTLPGDDESEATAINSKGVVAGWSYSSSHFTHGFLYSNGTMTDLGGGLNGPQPQALNNSSQVVGIMNNNAFFYSNGVFTNLGGLPGSGQSYATGINDAGVIVGHSYRSTLNPLGFRAFISTDDKTVVDLNSLISPASGWTIDAANGINNAGQIAAYGVKNGGSERALLLTPVPEPSAAYASIIAFSVFVVMSRWPRHRAPIARVDGQR
jgi:probable HAF family extracellular repeat protein